MPEESTSETCPDVFDTGCDQGTNLGVVVVSHDLVSSLSSAETKL